MKFSHFEEHNKWILSLFILTILSYPLKGADQPQWGEQFTRNMVSTEKNLPDSFDPETGENVKWVIPLGSQTYSTPVVSGGNIYIGTNNEAPRDPRHQGDRGVLFCLNEQDGSLNWQLVVPKLGDDPYLDWPKAGMSSPATVEGDRVYMVTNRGEVMCLDSHGMKNGNDGSFTREGYLMAESGSTPMQITSLDADIIWLFDMPRQLGVHQHDAAHCSILIDGRFLYINTSNGLNSKHTGVAAPDAPSLIVLDKVTGKLVARDRENIGQNIFHSTWSSPALGVINNKKYIIFGGGDGILYTFNALSDNQPDQTLNKVWWYDGDPAAPKTNVHEYIRNRRESPSNIKSMPVFHNSRVYLTLGGDIWWGKRKSWLKCIRANGEGNITSKNEIWSVPLEKHCCSTPSVSNGLVFVADCGGNIHCIDANSGELYWSHETVGAIWASTLVADGNVYVGTIRGDFFSLKADKTKQLLCHVKMDDPIYSTAVAANNVLYIATLKALYALSNQN